MDLIVEDRSQMLHKVGSCILSVTLTLLWVWSCLALWVDGGVLCLVIAILFEAVVLWILRKRMGLVLKVCCKYVGLLAVLVTVLWRSQIQPSDDRVWALEYDRKPQVRREGNLVTFKNLRDFRYFEDGQPIIHWRDKTVDMSKIRSLDLFLDYWSSDLIAHPIFSFGFEDGSYLAFSVETRREAHESYSAIKGFFKQFELIYLVGEESDLLNLRLHERKERLYWYPMKVTKEDAKAFFESYVRRIEVLQNRPEFYHAIFSNCTTDMRRHASQKRPWDYRILINGLMDRMIFDRQGFDRMEGYSFDDYKRSRKLHRDKVNRRATGIEFSEQIRLGNGISSE